MEKLGFDGAERTDKDGNIIGTTKQTWFYRVDMSEGYKHFSKTKPMLLSHLKDLDEWWKDRKELIVDGSPKAKTFTPEEIEKLNFNLDQCGYPKNETEILPPLELIAQYHQKRKELQDRIDTALSSILDKLNNKDNLS